jgi:mono/diheme cytochrome c family protein
MICALASLLAVSAFAGGPVHLDQDWTEEDRQWFYTTPQGSKAIPYSWALALEVPNAQTRWVSTLISLGFLPMPGNERNPDGLPVGFVRDGQHFGLTCAACHTRQINFRGTVYQVDGAPTDADFFGFMKTLADAAAATVRGGPNAPKFARFAVAVLGKKDSATARQKLYRELQAYNDYLTEFVTMLAPTTTPWGRARGDAFANMYNRVSAVDLNIPNNAEPGNAPASYPTLWDTSWEDKVEWNGMGQSGNFMLRLGRNVGELLGVFGEIEFPKPRFLRVGYPSTANRINMLELEQTLSYLRSPKWPFGKLDANKVALGEQIYIEQCRTCHAIVTPGIMQTMTMTPLDRVATDKSLAVVALARQAATGALKGRKEFIFFGRRLDDREPSATVLQNAVVGAIAAPFGSHQEFPRPRALTKNRVPPAPVDLSKLAYRARPLDGIWATAPYLHNGSVPTLWDLLSPPEQRPKKFYVGNREFDPVNVGEQTTPVPGASLLDTTLPGNSNSGHPWGTMLSVPERWALIEYLKSL